MRVKWIGHLWDVAASVQSYAFCFRVCFRDTSPDNVRGEVFRTLSYSDVEAIDLVKQCCLLVLSYSANFTSEVLSDSAISPKISEEVSHWSRPLLPLKQTLGHPSQSLVARVATSVGWLKYRMKHWTWIVDLMAPWPHFLSSSRYVKHDCW